MGSGDVNSRFSNLEADNNAVRPVLAGGTGQNSVNNVASSLFVEVAKLMYRVGDLKITGDNLNPGTYITGTTLALEKAHEAHKPRGG